MVEGLNAGDEELEAVALEDAGRAALLAAVPGVMSPTTTDEELPESVVEREVQDESAATPEVDTPATEATTASADDPVPIAFPDDQRPAIWPFVAYDAFWLAFAGVVVWQLYAIPAGQAVYDSAAYPFTVLGGLVLTAAGPVLILVSWLIERQRSTASGGLFQLTLIRGSVATLLGVALWWAALIALDQLRLGRLF